jgi:hypothetical protein
MAVKAKPPAAVTAETDVYTIKKQAAWHAAFAGKPRSYKSGR